MTLPRPALAPFLLAALLLSPLGCGSGSSLSWPATLASGSFGQPLLMAGTSLRDVWAIPALGATVQVQHFDGSAWTSVSVPALGAAMGGQTGVAVAGVGEAWITAGLTGPPMLVRVGTSGLIEDRSADLAAGDLPVRDGLQAHAGGVFVHCTSSGSGASALYHLVGGKFVAVAGTPNLVGVQLQAVIGPDEAYFATATSLAHYKAGSWPPLTRPASGLTRIAFSSTSDVWFWTLATNSGGAGFHGDGTTWTDFTVQGWPKFYQAGAVPLMIVSTGPGQVAFLGIDLSGDLTDAQANVVAIHVDATQTVTGEATLVDTGGCDPAGGNCYNNAAGAGIVLDDGTALLPGSLMADTTLEHWYAVRP